MYNENFKETYLKEAALEGKGLDYKLKRKISKCLQWYYEHLQGLTDSNKVFLLTDSQKSKKEYADILKGAEFGGAIITMEDFISMNLTNNPELVNYMGFAQQVDIEEETKDVKGAVGMFEDHLNFDEMVLGIREGKFFKGRLNVSRVNIEEGLVKVEGLNDDVLILGARNLNRALNGDIVCL